MGSAPLRAPSFPATHSEEAAGLALGPTAPWVVDEADVALGGAVHFPDPNGAEAPLEGLPHFCPEPTAKLCHSGNTFYYGRDRDKYRDRDEEISERRRAGL